MLTLSVNGPEASWFPYPAKLLATVWKEVFDPDPDAKVTEILGDRDVQLVEPVLVARGSQKTHPPPPCGAELERHRLGTVATGGVPLPLT